jgi:hypothetical protein
VEVLVGVRFSFGCISILWGTFQVFSPVAFAKCDLASELPKEVELRGHKMTRNQRYFFAVDGGDICFKSRKNDIDLPWQLLSVPEEVKGKTLEISSDDEFLVARVPGQANRRMLNALSEPKNFKWEAERGFPFGKGDAVLMPDDIVGWDISLISPHTDKYYLDTLGEHTVGVGCTTLFVLLNGGQKITYKDPWLPVDESNQVCGPQRGRFKAVAFSASGSTLFEMDQYGNSFGQRYDFDIAGADRVFIRYSYDEQASHLGFLNRLLSPRKLPLDGWHRFPPLPSLSGFYTDLISVEKTGLGARFREFRIEGVQEGYSGYYRLIHDFVPQLAHQQQQPHWDFIKTGVPLQGKVIGSTEREPMALDLGDAQGVNLMTHMGNIQIELEDFNGYCSPTPLRLSFGASIPPLELRLHTHEKLRISKISEQAPIDFNGAIEIPPEILADRESLPPEHAAFLKSYLGLARFTKVKIRRSADGVVLKSLVSLTRKSLRWTFSRGLR